MRPRLTSLHLRPAPPAPPLRHHLHPGQVCGGGSHSGLAVNARCPGPPHCTHRIAAALAPCPSPSHARIAGPRPACTLYYAGFVTWPVQLQHVPPQWQVFKTTKAQRAARTWPSSASNFSASVMCCCWMREDLAVAIGVRSGSNVGCGVAGGRLAGGGRASGTGRRRAPLQPLAATGRPLRSRSRVLAVSIPPLASVCGASLRVPARPARPHSTAQRTCAQAAPPPLPPRAWAAAPWLAQPLASSFSAWPLLPLPPAPAWPPAQGCPAPPGARGCAGCCSGGGGRRGRRDGVDGRGGWPPCFARLVGGAWGAAGRALVPQRSTRACESTTASWVENNSNDLQLWRPPDSQLLPGQLVGGQLLRPLICLLIRLHLCVLGGHLRSLALAAHDDHAS